jgi:hypothetical protein
MEDSTVPHPLEKSMQQATTIADEDLPLHSFSSITLFMRRRSAWLCVAGASLAYMAFVPPMLVVVPVMSKAFCLEVTSFQQRPAIAEAELHNPACEGLERIVNLIPDDFYVKATVSNLSSDFSTPTGRVFLACILLSSAQPAHRAVSPAGGPRPFRLLGPSEGWRLAIAPQRAASAAWRLAVASGARQRPLQRWT